MKVPAPAGNDRARETACSDTLQETKAVDPQNTLQNPHRRKTDYLLIANAYSESKVSWRKQAFTLMTDHSVIGVMAMLRQLTKASDSVCACILLRTPTKQWAQPTLCPFLCRSVRSRRKDVDGFEAGESEVAVGIDKR